MCRKIYFILIALFLLVSTQYAQTESSKALKVAVIPVQNTIELGLASFIQRSVEDAIAQNPSHAFFLLDTFGGRVDASLQIIQSIQELKQADIQTIALVQSQAWSAGALISLACDQIYMLPQATIGSAEPRQGAMSQEKTDEKTNSALRAQFRSTAQAGGYNALLAEAMVDPQVSLVFDPKADPQIFEADYQELTDKKRRKSKNLIEEIVSSSQLLNLTSQEAERYALSSGQVENLDQLLAQLSLNDAQKISYEENWAENLVRVLTHPLVNSLLIALAFWGLIYELRSPGLGLSGLVGVVALGLFFWGQKLVGLAEIGDLILLLGGLALIAVEVFIIPGFGFVGILGGLCLAIGLYLSLVIHPIPQNPWDFELFNQALFNMSVAGILFIIGTIFLMKYFRQTPMGRMLILNEQMDNSAGYKALEDVHDIKPGMTGFVLSTLKPLGRVSIQGVEYEAQSEGPLLDKGQNIEVTRISNNHIFVKGREDA